MEKLREHLVMKVSRNSIITNALLFVFKLLAGIWGHSAAMVSDAVHTLSDVLSTVVVIVGVKISGKQADKEHPYGHERFESVAALILAIMLFATGAGIGYGGVKSIITGGGQAMPVPGLLALSAAIISVVVKEAMYWYTRGAAKKVHSGALMADAWHHRSDALSSVGSFAGILGARMGYPVLDAVACLVICLLIVKASWDIFADSIDKMIDRACDDHTVEEIRTLILAQQDVRGIDLLQTRSFGDKIYVDVEIRVDGGLPLGDGHTIAHAVHDAIEGQFQRVKHCMVHVNPE